MYGYQILAIIALIFLALAVIFLLLFLKTDNEIVFTIAITMLIIGGINTVAAATTPRPAQSKYEQLKRDIERADKEMQKFLIEHPEFQN